MGNAIKNGATFRRNSEVVAIDKIEDHFVLTLKDGQTILTKHVINASGAASDQVASMLETDVEFIIKPRKGEYYVLDRKEKDLFDHVIYPFTNKCR